MSTTTATAKTGAGAGAATTRLTQYWHPVAQSSAITTDPVQLTLLGEKLVAFRDDAGEIAVFKDLCIHRGTALSLGWTKGGNIVCPYHGWEYDRSGACVHIPALGRGKPVPTRARAIPYHVEERYGLVWVAMEDPVAPVPGFPRGEDADPDYHGEIFLELTWETSAGRSVENSMDVSHFPFVHAGILGDPSRPEQEPYELFEEEWGVHYRVEDQYYGNPDGSLATNVERVSYEYYHWFPFSMHIRILEGEGRVTVLTALASPTEAKRTTVFRLVHRNYESEDSDFLKNYMYVLEQDRHVVESIRPEEIPTSLKEELHVKVPDRASIAFRRWLERVDAMGVAAP